MAQLTRSSCLLCNPEACSYAWFFRNRSIRLLAQSPERVDHIQLVLLQFQLLLAFGSRAVVVVVVVIVVVLKISIP